MKPFSTIAIPYHLLNSPFIFSSAVTFGLSYILFTSSSSEIARCSISSSSKYVIFILFMYKSPCFDTKIYLFTCCSMNSDWDYGISLFFIWDHNQMVIMPANSDHTSCNCIKILFTAKSKPPPLEVVFYYYALAVK